MSTARRVIFFRSKTYLQMLLAFYAVFIVPLGVVGAIVYRVSLNTTTAKVREEYEQKLVRTRNSIDDNFAILRNSSAHLSQMLWIKRILSMPDGTFEDLADVNDVVDWMNEVTLMSVSNGFVLSTAICFPRQDLVLSDRYKDTINDYFRYLTRIDGLDPDAWREILSARNIMTVLPLRTVTFADGSTDRVVSVVQTLSPEGGWSDGSIVYFVTEHRLMAPFDELVTESGGSILVVDANGQNIAKSVDPTTTPDRKLVVEAPIESLGWRCMYTVPWSAIHDRMSGITSYELSITALALILGTILAFVLARRNYLPLYRLMRSLTAEDRTPEPTSWTDDYARMTGSVKRLTDDAERSKSRIQVYFPLVKKKCVENVMRSPESGDEIVELLALIDVKLTHPMFCCMIVTTDAWHDEIDEIDTLISDESVTAVISQVDARFVVALCNVRDRADADRAASAIRQQLEQRQIDYRSIGVGNVYDSPGMLSTSCLEAQRAINQGEPHAADTLLFYSDIDPGDAMVNYGIRDEERLVNLLKIGNEEEAISTAFRILDTNLSLYPLTIKYLYGDLIMLPFRVVDNSLLEEHLRETSVGNDYQRVDDMKNQIARLYTYVCEQQRKAIDANESVTMRAIVQFVADHFNDRLLSLSWISDEFKLSPSQVSRLVKKATNVGFSDFVNGMRVEHAKQLLRGSTAMTRIQDESGFSNDVTFRRVFKKFTGVTPSVYHNTQQ